MNVLLIDDDPDMTAMLALLVEQAGHTPTQVNDAHEGLARLEADFFPLAIVDYRMPGLDGVELCRRLRRRQLGRQYTLILMVTAEADRAVNLLALQAGADDFMPKPVDADLFLARLKVAERLRSLRLNLEALREFLPVCMHCHKLRDEAGVWLRADRYLEAHSGSKVSHGLCPTCLATHYPETDVP